MGISVSISVMASLGTGLLPSVSFLYFLNQNDMPFDMGYILLKLEWLVFAAKPFTRWWLRRASPAGTVTPTPCRPQPPPGDMAGPTTRLDNTTGVCLLVCAKGLLSGHLGLWQRKGSPPSSTCDDLSFTSPNFLQTYQQILRAGNVCGPANQASVFYTEGTELAEQQQKLVSTFIPDQRQFLKETFLEESETGTCLRFLKKKEIACGWLC